MPDVDLEATRERDANVYGGFVDDPEAVTQQERDRHYLLARLDEAEQQRDRLRGALTVIRDERGSGYAAWEIANDALEDLDDG